MMSMAALAPAALQPQIHGHQHHLQAVREQLGPLLAHHRELEGNLRRQHHQAQRRQQPVRTVQRLHESAHEVHGLALHHGLGLDGQHVHAVVHAQVLVYGVAQLVLDQALVHAAVDARALVHQLDALVVEDGLAGHHVAMFGHVGDGAQEMHALVLPSRRCRWIAHGRDIRHRGSHWLEF
jgi:hypothetical protein